MVIYLNHILSNSTPSYGNSGEVELTLTRSMANGDTSNETVLHFSNHMGTHIDASFHFDSEGKCLDDYPAGFWECNHPYLIEYEAMPGEILDLSNMISYLEKIPDNTDILILKTKFEKYRNADNSIYSFQNPSLTEDVGFWLRKNRNLKFIGFDYISLSSRANREIGRASHRAFLCLNNSNTQEKIDGEPILVIEDMKLSNLVSPLKKIIIAPLLFEKSDGAPVTVFAFV